MDFFKIISQQSPREINDAYYLHTYLCNPKAVVFNSMTNYSNPYKSYRPRKYYLYVNSTITNRMMTFRCSEVLSSENTMS